MAAIVKHALIRRMVARVPLSNFRFVVVHLLFVRVDVAHFPVFLLNETFPFFLFLCELPVVLLVFVFHSSDVFLVFW